MIAPVLSFTDMPVVRPAGAAAVVELLAPEALAEGVLAEGVLCGEFSVLGAADGGVPAGAAEVGAPELAGGWAAGAVDLAAGAWAAAAPARARVAAIAAGARTFRMCLPFAMRPPATVNRRRLANVPAAAKSRAKLD
jgi:hypothetical protein